MAESKDNQPDSAPEANSGKKDGKRKKRNWWQLLPPYLPGERWRIFWRRYFKVWAVIVVIGILISFPAVRGTAYYLLVALNFNKSVSTLSVYDYCPVYTTNEKPVFLVNVTGANQLTYRLYPKQALKGRHNHDLIDHALFRPDLPVFSALSPEHHREHEEFSGNAIIEKTCPVQAFDVDRAGLEISLPNTLQPGDYILETEVPSAHEKCVSSIDFFRVTNLGLIVKSDPDKAVFQAIDLVTRKPRKDVQINLYTRARSSPNSCALEQLATARSTSDGFATIRRGHGVSIKDWSGLVVDAAQGNERAYCGPHFRESSEHTHSSYSYYDAERESVGKWGYPVTSRVFQYERLFLTTDRPVYRLGQRVFYSGTMMVEDTNGFANPGHGQKMSVHIGDPSYRNIADQSIATDSFGRFNGYFDIPQNAGTGAYSIKISLPNGNEQQFSVAVMQYRRPEYQVEVKPVAPYVVQSARAKVKIKSEYYFGAPVSNALLKYEFDPYVNPSNRDRFCDSHGPEINSFNCRYTPWTLRMPEIVTGTAITNSEGEAEVEIPTALSSQIASGPGSYDYNDVNYSIKVQATDASRMTVQGTGDVLVTHGDFALMVSPSTSIATTGDKIKVQIKALSYDKNVLPAKQVHVKLCRWDEKPLSLWERLELWFSQLRSGTSGGPPMIEVPAMQQDATTNADGAAEVTFSTPVDLKSAKYYVVAESQDSSHRIVGDVAELWIAGEDQCYLQRDQKPLGIDLDKSEYAPGAVAKALLRLPLKKGEEATALLSIEGRKLYDVKTLHLKGPSQIVEIPIEPQYMPNAFVCLTFIDNQHHPYTCSQELYVSPQQHILKMKLSSDRSSYKPGATVHYQIEARGYDNRPVKNTAIVLGVADQGVYDVAANVPDGDETFPGGISENPVSDISNAMFGQHIGNWVQTDFSFQEAYTGKFSDVAVFDGGGLGLAFLPVIGPTAPIMVPVAITMMLMERQEQCERSYRVKSDLECKMSPSPADEKVVPVAVPEEKQSALRMEGLSVAKPAQTHSMAKSTEPQFVRPPSSRKNFKELAAWMPALVTDSNGFARAEVKLPDDLTTWKATAYGVTGTNVGFTESNVISTLPLAARLALPRFFTEGDSGYLTAILNNNSNQKQSVKITLKPSKEFSTMQPLTRIFSVGPKGSLRYSWPVRVSQSGDASVSLLAQGTDYGDALERKLPVRSFGYTAFFMRSGVLSDATAEKKFPIILPVDAKLRTGKFHLSLSSSTIGPVLGNFDTLIDYPYGCTEQTMSRLEPSIVAMHLRRFGVSLSKADSDKFEQVYQIAMRKLVDYQHEDGGWGWWKDDKSEPYLSALVMEGFTRLRQVGYQVDRGVVDKGLEFLRAQSNQLLLSSWSRDEAITHAKLVYVLSLYKERPSTASTVWHMANVSSMSPEELSYLTLAFKNVADDRNCQAVYKRLLALRNDTGEDFTDWDHSDALYQKLGMKASWCYTYRFTGIEATALALRAVAAADPGNENLIDRTCRWILSQRDQNGWGNTKTTSEVFEALLEKELAVSGGKSPNFRATVAVGRKVVNSFAFDKLIEQGERTADLGLLDKPKEVLLSKNGQGRLYYSSLLQYERPLKSNQELIGKSVPMDMHIARTLFELKQIGTSREHAPLYATIPLGNQPIKAGSLILMKVSIHSPLALPYVMVEAPLPSGAEVAPDVLVKVKHTNEQTKKEYYTEEHCASPCEYCSHADVLDDRMAYFFSDIPTGDLSFSRVLRMEMPGRFHVNPVTLQAMYTSSIRGYSAVDTMNVAE